MYALHVGHFGRILGADTPMGALLATEWDRYFATRGKERIGKRVQKRVSASTLAHERGTARQLLVYAKRTNRYTADPDVVLPSIPTEYVPGTRSLTWEQIPRLLAELEPHRQATAAFILATGADVAAVPRARAEDWAGGTVLVRGSKNTKRWARIPIVPPFELLAEQARLWLVAHGSFTRWGKSNSVRDLAAACRRAKLPRVTLRDLRRTFGRVLRARGVEPSLIGPMLRHTTGRMAELVYATLEPEDLGRLVSGARPKKRAPRKKAG